MNKYISTLGNRLRELRSSKMITQRVVGLEVGLSMQAINDIEHDRRSTTADKLISLADFFDVSLDYLVGRTDEADQPYQTHPALPDEAKTLLATYFTLSASDRKKLLDYMKLLQAAQKKE